MKSVAIEELHLDVLPPETAAAFAAVVTLPFLGDPWYLAGGTALALQVGHRSSEDLDFFTTETDFDTALMERDLTRSGSWETSRAEAGTLYGSFQGAKMSLIAYPFFSPMGEPLRCGTVRLLPPDNIASMKIIAISQRSKKRDFVDMYWWMHIHNTPLNITILRATEQFPGRKHNMTHFLRSLTYFEDAENDPMPKLNFKADWEEMKQYFRDIVPGIAKELLGIGG